MSLIVLASAPSKMLGSENAWRNIFEVFFFHTIRGLFQITDITEYIVFDNVEDYIFRADMASKGSLPSTPVVFLELRFYDKGFLD